MTVTKVLIIVCFV